MLKAYLHKVEVDAKINHMVNDDFHQYDKTQVNPGIIDFNLNEESVFYEPFPARTQINTKVIDVSIQQLAHSVNEDTLLEDYVKVDYLELVGYEEIDAQSVTGFIPLVMEVYKFENPMDDENAYLVSAKKMDIPKSPNSKSSYGKRGIVNSQSNICSD
jgi:hypothetical protein